jgi:hypothetical protein
MVQNSEWGPPLWRILHTLAERVGKQTVLMLAQDETRAWIGLLQHVEGIMPCQMCRGHYRAWRTRRSLEGLYGGSDASREWVWALHEDVNQRRGVTAEQGVPFARLTELYGPGRNRQEFQQDIDTLVAVLLRAAQQRLVDGGVVRDWQKRLGMLRRLVGF